MTSYGAKQYTGRPPVEKKPVKTKKVENRIMNNKTGIIKRIDHPTFTDRIHSIIYFCNHCDPKEEGGHRDVINRFENYIPENSEEYAKRTQHFYPTYGAEVD